MSAEAGHAGDLRITILLGEANPPVGSVVAGARQDPFAGWLELFQVLGHVVEKGEELPGLPGAGELPPR